MENDFPNIVFGKCEVCGMDGDDATNISSADSSSNTDAGYGIELIPYQGKWVCDVCKNRLISDDESRDIASKIAEDERFRNQVGFKRTI